MPKERLPNIIIFSIDTLRADHLGLYGYPRSVSPAIDAISRSAFVFTNVTSQSPITAPSHMSIFTSVYPEIHRVRNFGKGAPKKLSRRLPTLAEILRKNGYETIAFTDGGNVSGSLGFSRGFNYYGESGPEGFWHWIKKAPYEPWFAFLHAYWVHDPYLTYSPFHRLFDSEYDGDAVGEKKAFRRKFGDLGFAEKRKAYWKQFDFFNQKDRTRIVELYDGALRCADMVIQALIELLNEMNLTQRTVLIIISDHGEEFFEHSRILHERLYRETLHVPFIITDFNTRIKPGLTDHPVGLVDLTPTLLDYLDIPVFPSAQGISRLDLIEGRSSHSGTLAARADLPYKSQMIQEGEWKYIFNPVNIPPYSSFDELGLPRPAVPKEELYRISEDPGEKRNLADIYPHRLESMRRDAGLMLKKFDDLAESYPPSDTSVDEESVDKLKALGYLQ